MMINDCHLPLKASFEQTSKSSSPHPDSQAPAMDRKKQHQLEKKSKRQEELARKKSVDAVVKGAYDKPDLISEFPAFLKFDRNGLDLHMEMAFGDGLSLPLKRYIMELLKVNMSDPYGPEWPAEEKIKRRDMVSPQARYIVVRRRSTADGQSGGQQTGGDKNGALWSGDGDPVVAFVHFRFVVERDVPVLYVYELQLERSVQGRGLGKFLMLFMELLARKNNLKGILLTVQKRNIAAMKFYTGKLRFIISSISPSRADPLTRQEASYEILCKTFDPEAKKSLE